jgi:hypothetical protein
MLNEQKDWDEISVKLGLTEVFIRENANKVNWYFISYYQKLSEEFIREFSDKIDWDCVSQQQKLSEDFIREFSKKVNWYHISIYQKLSEEFIREFSNEVDWNNISIYQKLSEGFIREFFKKLYYIERYQKLSPEFIKEYNLTIPETCWLYKDKEFKREYIKTNTSYEIIGDKVIAYKTCREDGYSRFNFQYHYETGKEYEAHADYNINNYNSFGLSAWIKEKAIEYYNIGKLFKVEIDLDDIAAIVHEGNKIRASKIKILEEVGF